MIGSKLRSWMEAVRPRKKQNRKEKVQKIPTELPPRNQIPHDSKSHDAISCSMASDGKSTETLATQPRYSGTNLSSPESAYSTGYSTDGTSPGAPPEYYINIRTGTRYFPSNPVPTAPTPTQQRSDTIQYANPPEIPSDACIQSAAAATLKAAAEKPSQRIGNEVAVMSPRQRNRIRTNPWVASSGIPGSPRLDASDSLLQPVNAAAASTVPNTGTQRYPSPSVEKRKPGQFIGCDTLSSSSCSSLSATSLHCALPARPRQAVKNGSLSDDEDDHTLNEMMGKYDESYVYEKETDILSDSDPTDCETDIDTGQDGGDEDDPMDEELDFIDNGSFLEFGIGELHEQSKGHCTYHSFHAELSRKSSSRRRDFLGSRTSVRKSNRAQGDPNKGDGERDRERRQRSSKKKHINKQMSLTDKNSLHIHNVMLSRLQIDGSRSAGATPVSVRRTPRPISKLAIGDSPAKLKWRSNSVSLSRPAFDATFDRRDQEADKKYKELIVEAEHILMSMRGSSPRRAPGPPNKRVELLRYAEASTPELFLNKNRLNEDVPSINVMQTGCSPKKNHITNFINNNSPVATRRAAAVTGAPPQTAAAKIDERRLPDSMPRAAFKGDVRNSPVMRHRSPAKHAKKDAGGRGGSPKHEPKRGRSSSRRKKYENGSSSEESDCLMANAAHANRAAIAFRDAFSCPQSEPVKRKVYMGHTTATAEQHYDHQYVTKDSRPYTHVNFQSSIEHTKNSTDPQMSSLRRQVLLNTIANLKRNLESQSASLQQVYSSTQNIPAWASKH